MADPTNPWDNWTFELAKMVVSAFFGAGIGAWTAAMIASRNKTRDELAKELRTTNLAATIAYGITQAFIEVKKGHVRPMYEGWCKDKERSNEALRKAQAGEPVDLVFDADFRMLAPVKAGVEELRQLMFADINLEPFTISVINTLERSTEQHGQIIESLNKRIEEINEEQPDHLQLAAIYFGLKIGTRVDERFPSTLRGLYNTTDDCIFFSKMLAEDLIRHGKIVASRLPKRLRGGYALVDFSRSEKDGLLPDPAMYPTWLMMLAQVQPPLGLGIWSADFERLALAQIHRDV